MHHIKSVESLCCSFLCKGCSCRAYRAKISWSQVSKPKTKGGLGLKRVADWNKACLARIIWLLFNGSDSLWIAWIKAVILTGENFGILYLLLIPLGAGEGF